MPILATIMVALKSGPKRAGNGKTRNEPELFRQHHDDVHGNRYGLAFCARLEGEAHLPETTTSDLDSFENENPGR